ncbi:MAG: cyclic dehypoxanthinyl futalosine synthase [Coriobacteriia bacterium]
MSARERRESGEVAGEFRSRGRRDGRIAPGAAEGPRRGLSEPPTSPDSLTQRPTAAARDDLHALAFAAARGEHRLSAEEALALLEGADILPLGAAATAMRDRLHPEREITFIVDRNVNYTNVCVSGCRFCAFYRDADDADAYVLAPDELYAKVEETLALEGTAILLQGGLHPDLGIEWYEQMLRALKERFPIHVHGFGPPEMVHIARVSGISTREVLARLRDAGLDSLPGGGAEILVDRVRSHVSPKKATSDEWLDVMREAHELGMSTTATMMFGGLESAEERVEHLRRIREVQDEAAEKGAVGFRAFIPWSFQPGNTELAQGEFAGQAATGWEYLRTLAVSRLFLDNVVNIQASWVTQGPKIGQVALCFGANDMGSTMIEENVVASAGTRFMLARKELVRLIRDAGFTPVQRDTLYREVRRF